MASPGSAKAGVYGGVLHSAGGGHMSIPYHRPHHTCSENDGRSGHGRS